MKKKLIMWTTFFVVFLVSMVITYYYINRDNEGLSMDMDQATLPLVQIELDGTAYNLLHGYTDSMEINEVAEYIFPLDTDRSVTVRIDSFGEEVESVSYEVRNSDSTRLIETGEAVLKSGSDDTVACSFTLKDLISEGEEYILVLSVSTRYQQDIHFYTRFLYAGDNSLTEQLNVVWQFHESTFDKENGAEYIAPFMETDGTGDDSTLAYVDLHCSTSQVMWGGLEVEIVSEIYPAITSLDEYYGGYTLTYYAQAQDEDNTYLYQVCEKYLLRTSGEDVYMIEYERTVDVIYSMEGDLYSSNIIMLGILNDGVTITESEDGAMAVFVINGCLYYYDDNENCMTYVYGFKDSDEPDLRNLYGNHDIRVLQVDEAGSMTFLVYGYMNRGDHEGSVGIGVYYYDATTGLREELAFIKSTHSAQLLMQEVETLACLVGQESLYFYMDGSLCLLNLTTQEISVIYAYNSGQDIYVSESGSALVIQGEEGIVYLDLENETRRELTAPAGQVLLPLGFIGDDFVYGYAYTEEESLNQDGSQFYYMYRICIEDADGEVLKDYQAENVRIREVTIDANQLILERYSKSGDTYTTIADDNIVSRKSSSDTNNTVGTVVTSTYQTIYQISLKNKIDVSSLIFSQAKEMEAENVESLTVGTQSDISYVAVLSPWEVTEYTTDAGYAVKQADSMNGIVRDNETGSYIWRRKTLSDSNQIIAIEAVASTEEQDSVAVCLKIMLEQLGIYTDVQERLNAGESCSDILDDQYSDYTLIEVTGCSLTSLLYYVDQDIPVLIILESGEAMLLTGFNSYNVVVMRPDSDFLGYMSRSDASEMLSNETAYVYTFYQTGSN
ncbi:MAG: hypothetical protein LUC95_00530 [Lachnospiraceae bacterium]|nr:hypothetical protein [Lachnospiraceae bacterium]